MDSNKHVNSVVKVALPLLLGGAILYWMYRDFDFGSIREVLKVADYRMYKDKAEQKAAKRAQNILTEQLMSDRPGRRPDRPRAAAPHR